MCEAVENAIASLRRSVLAEAYQDDGTYHDASIGDNARAHRNEPKNKNHAVHHGVHHLGDVGYALGQAWNFLQKPI